ncbi:hypothetical protein K0M31_017309 [Melipona bicolor]|uniref:Uncharacterized protein n=1 Tax=Melipona bicolor TaxID=60889 RepID=A0AA40KSJ3_9HYME|nr:hypothetical protein K0M31_017309 [Melipona bicolor]
MATSKVSRSAKKRGGEQDSDDGEEEESKQQLAASKQGQARWLALPGLARLGAVAAAAAVTAAVAIDVPLTKQANEYLQNAINTLYTSALRSGARVPVCFVPQPCENETISRLSDLCTRTRFINCTVVG